MSIQLVSRRFLALALPLVLTACIVNRKEHEGVASLQVKLVTPGEAGRGTREAPLETPRGIFPVKVEVVAFDIDGNPMDCEPGHRCFEGSVSFLVSPGWIPVENPLPAEREDTPFVMAQRGQILAKLVAGRAEKTLDLRGVFAETHVWAEEWPDEDSPKARYAAGASETLYFQYPSIQDIQYDPALMSPDCAASRKCDNTSSPLVDNFIETRPSRYLVTGLTNDGFFVSDLSEETSPKIGSYPGRFESLFAYNFSYPEDLAVGDVVTKLFGTVQEFTGDTQITFPSWDKEDPAITAASGFNAACTEPADCPEGFLCQTGFCRIRPTPITMAVCGTNNNGLCGHSAGNIALESLESARVELTEAFMPTEFRNCDFNGDGDVPNFNPTIPCGEECTCKDACIKAAGCSELSALHTYGQYVVTLVSGNTRQKINVTTRDSSPNVIPDLRQGEDAAQHQLWYGDVRVRVRGNLRQALPARPRWNVVAGEKDDFCCLPRVPADAGKCREIPLCKD